MGKIIKILSMFLLFSCFLATTAFAALGDVRFSWLPNSETNIAGYKIHYGTNDDGVYPHSVDMNSATTTLKEGRLYGSVDDLVVGTTYYFVCTAYNTSGQSSGFSNRIIVAVESGSPTIINISME